MYSGKLAPHKSGTQSSREEAVKNGRHADTRAHQPPAREGEEGGTRRENEERRIEKKQKGGFFLKKLSLCIFTFDHNHCMCCTVIAQQQAGEAAV